MRTFTTHAVPVAGGELRAIQWGPRATDARETVIAVHGITASSRSMLTLAEAIDPDLCLVAVDLRGRGDSNELPAPFGMDAHADDVAAVADHLGADRFIVLGHSMGAHVATTTAGRFRDRVKGLVLVDGGMPLPVPPGIDADIVLNAVIGPAIARFALTFESMEAYFDFWRVHPSFVNNWSTLAEEYFRYDVEGEAPSIRPRGSEEAVRADSRDLVLTHATDAVIRSVVQPIEFVRVHLGIMNEPPGFQLLELCTPVVEAMDNVNMTSIDDFNHYSILLNPAGVRHVNEALERLLSRLP